MQISTTTTPRVPTNAPERTEDEARAAHAPLWMPAAGVGGIAAAAMVGPSLFPKNAKLQAVGMGIAALAGAGVGAGIEGAIRGADSVLPGDRLATQLGATGLGAAVATGVSLASRGPARGAAALARSAGIVTATAGGVASAGTLAARSDASIPGPNGLTQAGVATVAAGGMLAASAIALRGARGTSHLLPSLPELSVDAARTGTLAINHGFEVRGPLTSGGAHSRVSWDAMPAPGRRFLSEMPRAAEIDHVMGTSSAREPIRAYVGLDHTPPGLDEAAGVSERARLAVDELDRLGAFGRFERDARGVMREVATPRASILLAAPTSTGFVNPVAVSSHEFLRGGDTATAAIQVARSKSASELHRVARSTASHQALIEAVSARIAAMPPEASVRPELRIYGESFGAWSGQNGFAGSDAAMVKPLARRLGNWNGAWAWKPDGVARMDALGVDQALWVGTPSFSKLRPKVLSDASMAGGAAPRAISVRNLPQARDQLTPERTEQLRMAFLQHDADPVGLFSPKNFYEDFLGPKQLRGENISRQQRFIPGVTGLQTALDQQMAQYFKPGTLEAKGHDYRSEVPYFLAKAMRTDASNEQVGRIGEWNRQLELIRDAR